MRKVTAVESLTLDGVMQAPARPDEDTRGGFETRRLGDSLRGRGDGPRDGRRMQKAEGGALVLGRRTYEDFADVWPKRKDNPYTEALNRAEKYVASTTLTEPLPWQNSTVARGRRRRRGWRSSRRSRVSDIGILGSGELVRSLVGRGLIDEFLLLIHPLVLGSGTRLFPRMSWSARARPTA